MKKLRLLVSVWLAVVLCGYGLLLVSSDGIVYANEASKQTTQKVKIAPLKRGDKNEYVKTVQQLMAVRGYYFDAIDGAFGKNTEQAVRTFQREQGLTVSGIVDRKTFEKLKSKNLVPRKVEKKLKVHISAYSAEDPGCSKYTATGQLLRKGIVAVDPTVIPLGTKMYIPGYGYGIATDIGSAIKGDTIDVAFDSREEALKFGRRDLVIQILEEAKTES